MRSISRQLRALLLALLVATGAAPGAAAQTVPDTLEAGVDSLMAAYDGDASPGAVVGLIRGGEVVFAKGYGTADLASGTPITPHTRFNVGSVSKQFLGYAFAMLDGRGTLSLDDPVADHMEDWPRFADTVRIRHLLTHTSGYREAYGMMSLAGRPAGRNYMPREEALEVVRRQPALEFPAGSEYSYNSTAYVVLAELFERVTGEPAAAWVTGHLLEPLGMDETEIETEVGQVVPGAADSYTDREGGGYLRVVSNRAIFGAAEVFTTVGDVAKWFRNFRTAEVGGPEARARFLEPFVLTDGDSTDYALGIGVDEHRGLRRYAHSGVHAGYRAWLAYYPEIDAGVVVMSNYDRVPVAEVAEGVAELAFGDRMEPEPALASAGMEPVELDPAVLAACAGSYRSEEGDVLVFTAEEDTLMAAGRFPLVPVADTLFRDRRAPVEVRFRREEGEVTRATVRRAGRAPRHYRRFEPWEPTSRELASLAGDYWSPELETRYAVAVADSGLVARHRWRGRMPLEPVETNGFRTGDGLRLDFERNEMGQVTGFFATVGRTRNVWFQKRE